MPLTYGRTSDGKKYVKWGNRGKKYFYQNATGRNIARAKAIRQARAIKYRMAHH